MNLVDWVIVAIVGISILFGLYRGFIASVLNVGVGLICFVAAFMLYPKLAGFISGDPEIVQMLAHYTEAYNAVGDLQVSMMNVVQMGAAEIDAVVQNLQLPAPLGQLLQYNLENGLFASAGYATVADYVSQTILQASINIICFVITFFALYLVLSVVLCLIRAVFRFPVLKQLDALAGGVFGFLRGLLICLALFTLVPLVQTIVPMEELTALMEESTLASVFSNGNLILAIMNGHL